VASLCHPWFTTTNPSYRFPIFETSAAALCGTTGTSYFFSTSLSSSTALAYLYISILLTFYPCPFSMYLSYLPIYPSTYLRIYLFTYLPIYLRLPIYLSSYLAITSRARKGYPPGPPDNIACEDQIRTYVLNRLDDFHASATHPK